MILCDIGNSTYHFFYNNQSLKFPVDKNPVLQKSASLDSDCIFYISVNKEAEENLNNNNHCIDLKKYAKLESKYDLIELGTDRIILCLSIENGIIIDAGSATTIDVVENNVHMGGYILPGLSSYQRAYASISSVLNKQFNLGVPIDTLPLNTVDSMSGGMLHSTLTLIKSISKDKKIYVTGGDGKFFSRFFPKAGIYDKFLIFRGMKRIIEENNLLEETKI